MTANGAQDPSGQDPSGDTGSPSATRRAAPAWLTGVATSVKARLADNTSMLALMIFINLVVILAGAAIWYRLGGDPTVIGVVAGALLAFVGGMLSLIRARTKDTEELPLYPPLMLAVIPLAVLVVGLSSWAVWTYLESRPVQLADEFSLEPEGPVEGGKAVLASAHTDRTRPVLTITFSVSEYDPQSPVCAPNTQLTVALRPGTGRNRPQTKPAGEEFRFDLGEGVKDIRLSVEAAAERNCKLDLKIDSARLDD
ncbi:hypothetical protein [Streptomyces sp. MZ04]|uniref:hypothetical protein n=1 Tax=Streptomyces sp. MZ04 TaxID=2559236 RepID=UPI00107E89A6|nr:hypothetical protein [Streptomyces sp. MZ04]TGB13184.1 hypothetical protein E2651_10120 [Streptomyces sp. MZ04]